MFTNKKREGINTFVCAVSLYVAETLKTSIKNHEAPLPIIPFGIVACGFGGYLSRNSCIHARKHNLYYYITSYCINKIGYHSKLLLAVFRQFSSFPCSILPSISLPYYPVSLRLSVSFLFLCPYRRRTHYYTWLIGTVTNQEPRKTMGYCFENNRLYCFPNPRWLRLFSANQEVN